MVRCVCIYTYGEEHGLQTGTREFGNRNILYHDYNGGYMSVYICQNSWNWKFKMSEVILAPLIGNDLPFEKHNFITQII